MPRVEEPPAPPVVEVEPERTIVKPESVVLPPAPAAPGPVARRRSTTREAEEEIRAAALPAVRAMKNLAGIGDDPELAARDEATRARLLMDLADRGGLRAPSQSVVAHVVVDMEEALSMLERLQGEDAPLDVDSEEVG